MRTDTRELGRRIAEQRHSMGLTQEQLAERASVNVKTIQGVEQGRSEPELRTMRKIAKAMGTPLDVLTGTGRKGSLEVLIKQITTDLRTLPPSVVEHFAALARAMARRGR
jgi:transcriptional regulator with XRE-family HTH domain